MHAKFREDTLSRSRIRWNLVENGVNNGHRYEYSINFYDSFFILFSYSYKICLLNFKGLSSAVHELDRIWLKMR